MTFLEFQTKFPTEQAIINYFINIRYNGKVTCNHCGSEKVYHRSNEPKVYTCMGCHNSFSIFKGTIFEKSSTDLTKWMYAIQLFLNGKKGISGCQLQRELGVTYKTAWRMLQQIRKAMGNGEALDFANTTIEMDEAYLGGKPRKENKHDDDDDKKNNKRGRGTKKPAVVGVIDRENKKVHVEVAMPDSTGKQLTGKQLLNILRKVSKAESKNTIITDQFHGYDILDKSFVHMRVDHNKIYVDGEIHTNNIEGFWANLKRGIYGIYHHVSLEYLQNYINEFCFRYNHRKEEMVDMVLRQAII